MFLVILLGVFSIFKVIELSSLTSKFYEQPFRVTNFSYKIQKHLISIHRYMKDVVLSDTDKKLNLAISRIELDEEQIIHELKIIAKQYSGDKKEIKNIYNLVMQWREIRNNVIELMRQNKVKQAIEMNQGTAYMHANKLIKSAETLTKYANNTADIFVQNSNKSKELTKYLIIILVIVILIVILSILFLLLKSLRKANLLKMKKDNYLIQQSRLAQMGELISMIAHQWRQPLGAISAASVDLRIKLELEFFDIETAEGRDEAIKYFLNGLEEISQFVTTLTSTIDDFRNFYKPNKKIIKLKLPNLVSKTLNIIQASLNNSKIEILEDYQCNQELLVYDRELMQVILNLLQNSQDNFEEKKTKDPQITIGTKDKTIFICDNGGGIPLDIINKIFDPYFSTKLEKNGTGLGLYMSKTIIEEHHNGTLTVKNIDNGVCFFIDLNNCENNK